MIANMLATLLTTLPVGDSPHEKSEEMRLKVTILGFKVERETWDQPFQIDGKGDEIRVQCDVHMHLKGLEDANCVCNSYLTRVFGDINHFPDRILAGSRSLQGGLRTGDYYPGPNPWVLVPRPNNHPGDLPLVVYNDPLLPGEKVILNPMLLEVDGESSYVTKFSTSIKKLEKTASDNLIGQLPIAVGTRLVIGVTDGFHSIFGKDGDRPIGSRKESDGKLSYTPKAITLTQTTALRLANLNSPYGKGVLALRFEDDPTENLGVYQMYVRIEISH